MQERIAIINERDKSIVGLRKSDSQLIEELNAIKYKHELVAKECETKTAKAKRFEQIVAESGINLEKHRELIEKLKGELNEVRRDQTSTEQSVEKYRKIADSALLKLAQLKGVLIRFAGLKSDLSELKLAFINLQTFVIQRVDMLPKLIRHMSMCTSKAPAQIFSEQILNSMLCVCYLK